MQGSKPKYPRSKVNQWLLGGELSELEDLPIVTATSRNYGAQIAHLEMELLARDQQIAHLKAWVLRLEIAAGFRSSVNLEDYFAYLDKIYPDRPAMPKRETGS